MSEVNRRIVLAERPQGRPGPQNFRLEQVAVALFHEQSQARLELANLFDRHLVHVAVSDGVDRDDLLGNGNRRKLTLLQHFHYAPAPFELSQ